MASNGASSSSDQWKYDVFLSFFGEDTRKNFTDHLFKALVREGILTFRDSEELNRGKHISSDLMAAIKVSRVAIIVFSEKYASSTWCLDELVKILDCKRNGQTEKVLPVFYKIDPSDVRKQSKGYSQAFRAHEKRFKMETGRVQRWRAALTEAANLSGWDQREVANGHESELIKNIVKEVLAITSPGWLHVSKCPTGLEPHISAICLLLNDGGSDVVHTIGIYGPGGIGKTTIAKAVFNIMSRNFEGTCFLADVREVSSQQQGSVHLQKQLLSDILKREGIEIHNEHRGINIINKHLCCKRVLIVFDDVVKMTQLDKLVGGVDWFCPGSRIILTTRDEHLLTELDMEEKYKYRVETMDEHESLRLFSRHAFRQNHPLEGYEQLSEKVVQYAGGLPLALVILGSLLHKRKPTEWEFQLEKLKHITIDEVSEKLKISYDALDKFDRSIFLDISCFFIGCDKDNVSIFLDACYHGRVVAIKNLKERSLVTIDEHNKLHMHDLIRDMGRKIVHDESPKNPGERSRVWKADGSIDMLRNLTVTDVVEGFDLDYWENEQLSPITTNAFSRMPNLRLLRIYHGPRHDRGILDWENSLQKGVILFRKLVWLYWEGFPFKYIPENFHLGNVVILEMRESNLREIWEGTKKLTMLKVLDLRRSPYLTHMPDFSGFPYLERLDLGECNNLVEVQESIHCLEKLASFKLDGCSSLRNLPRGIEKLRSLEVLDVSSCWKLQNLPKGFEELKCLRKLNLSRCNWTDDGIAGGLGKLYLLESLDSSYNKFKCLPMLPSSLCSLNVEYCFDLEKLPYLSNLKHLLALDLTGCGKVTEIQGLEGLKSATIINLCACIKLETTMKKRIFQDISKEFGDGKICDIFLPGNEVPDWFAFQNDDCRVIAQLHNMEMQPHQQGLIICSTFDRPDVFYHDFRFHVEVFNNSKNSTWKHAQYCRRTKITWMIKVPNGIGKSNTVQYEPGDTLTVSAYSVFVTRNCKTPYKRYDPDKIGLHFF